MTGSVRLVPNQEEGCTPRTTGLHGERHLQEERQGLGGGEVISNFEVEDSFMEKCPLSWMLKQE